MSNKLKITLSKSLIGSSETQRKTVKSLGLNKVQSSVIKADNESLRGQINKIKHLVTITAVEDE